MGPTGPSDAAGSESSSQLPQDAAGQLPEAYNFEPPPGDIAAYAVEPRYQVLPDLELPDQVRAQRAEIWSTPPSRQSFEVSINTATRTRLTPLETDGGLGVLPTEGMYGVEVERQYSRQWPGVVRVILEDGTTSWSMRPGFLEPFADPELPRYFFVKGVERIAFTAGERGAQAAAMALYALALAGVSAALAALSPQLLACAAASWVRSSLSLGKWALLAVMFFSEKLWLYWVFMLAKMLDGILERHAPSVRKFAWGNFTLWVLYVAFTPAHWHPLPLIALS